MGDDHCVDIGWLEANLPQDALSRLPSGYPERTAVSARRDRRLQLAEAQLPRSSHDPGFPLRLVRPVAAGEVAVFCVVSGVHSLNNPRETWVLAQPDADLLRQPAGMAASQASRLLARLLHACQGPPRAACA
jgi:hypothetical protein